MTAPLPDTLLDRIAWRADNDPSGEALIFDRRPWSYGEMWARVERTAAGLLGCGVERGARVVVAVPNGPDFFAAFYGTLRCGAIAVPVFPGSGAKRLIRIAQRCGAGVVVASKPSVVTVEAERTSLQALTVDMLAADEPGRVFPTLAPDHVAYIQYTSGSTGEPKGVQVTHANIVTNVEQMIAGMGITRREVFVSWLPVHHDMGLVLMTMVPFYLGARLILLPTSLRHVRFWLSQIDEYRGTFTAAPDFAYRLCLRRVGDRSEYDLSSLRVALNAAEPVRARTLEDFQETFGLGDVMVPGYGLAEATVGVSMWPPGVAVKIDQRGFPSVGRGFPSVEMAILGEADLLGPNEVGEILVRSSANTAGYWKDELGTAELFWQRGYLRTGDLGYLDDDGDLFVVGRRKNIIIQAGRNIAPCEVEDLIDAFPFVRLAAAVGVDRGRTEGEQIYAFVELRSTESLDRSEYRRMAIELTHAVRSHLGLGPGRLYLMPPRSIPLTHNGKIRHLELKHRYLDGSLRSEGRLLFPDF